MRIAEPSLALLFALESVIADAGDIRQSKLTSQGIRNPNQIEIRLPRAQQVWQRSAALANCALAVVVVEQVFRGVTNARSGDEQFCSGSR